MSLTQKQLDFLSALSPWVWRLEELTMIKAQELRSYYRSQGLSSIVLACEIIDSSNWGTHPLAQETYKGKPSNNLTLLPVTPGWDGKKTKFDGKEYKLFSSWEDFCVHYSDLIVFSSEYKEVLQEINYLKQLEMYCKIRVLTKSDFLCYTRYVNILNLLGIKTTNE